MMQHGVPDHLRCDSGPESVAFAIQDWLKNRGVATMYIALGSSWENAHVEPFHH